MSRIDSGIYKSFPGYDRLKFPDNIKRVTAGFGGEAFLIFTEKKTALYDCGMAYCHMGTVKNIEDALKEKGRDKIDYLLVSHSHYDHIGAMPYILERWPETEVIGAAKNAKVFNSEGARKTMKRLGEVARENFRHAHDPSEIEEEGYPIKVDGFRLDRAVKEGDRIDMGDGSYFAVIETKGHTDCSMTYVLEPEKIMFLSESTGVLRGKDLMYTVILKSYKDSMEAAEKCSAYGAKQLIGPHYGMVPEYYSEKYFELYKVTSAELKDYILHYAKQGYDHDQLLAKVEEKCWTEERRKAQPKEAFLENAGHIVDLVVKEFLQEKKD